MNEVTAYPLAWPFGWKRTDVLDRRDGPFKVSFEQAKKDLHEELRLLGAEDVMISSNIPVRSDGLPYADWSRRRIDDPGVAIYFKRRSRPTVLACDKWSHVIDNLRSISLSLAAIRGLERWGASDMMDRAFTGFLALPPPPKERSWREVLGFTAGAIPSPERVREAHRSLAIKFHPDRGGDANKMAELNRAYHQAIQEVG